MGRCGRSCSGSWFLAREISLSLVVLSVLIGTLVGCVTTGAWIGGGDRVREFLGLLLTARRVLVPFNVEQTVDQAADDDQYDLKDSKCLLFLTRRDDPVCGNNEK